MFSVVGNMLIVEASHLGHVGTFNVTIVEYPGNLSPVTTTLTLTISDSNTFYTNEAPYFVS